MVCLSRSWALQKWLNWLRCHLGFGLSWAGPKEVCFRWGCTLLSPCKYNWTVHVWWWCSLFRSSPPSRPNNIREGLKCPSVGMSVRSSVHKVFPIPMKFGVYIEVDERCTTVCCITWFEVKVTGPLKFRYCTFPSLSPPPFTMGAGKWWLILKLEHNI